MTSSMPNLMATEPRVPRARMTGLYGGLLKMAMKKMLGGVPAGAEVMWHHPAIFKDTMKYGRRTEKWDQLDHELVVLATMATAAEIGCSFCLDLHDFMSHNKGFDEAKAREVPRWRESDLFTSLERDVMRYAEAMSQTPPTVTDELSARLLEQLGAPGLVELAAFAALANSMARTNVALGIKAQGFSAACGLPPMAQPSSVAS